MEIETAKSGVRIQFLRAKSATSVLGGAVRFKVLGVQTTEEWMGHEVNSFMISTSAANGIWRFGMDQFIGFVCWV